MLAQATNLNAQVLVLNKLWMAVRVTNARRAFSLLVRNLAEVIRVDDGSYAGHDFESWAQLSTARQGFVKQAGHREDFRNRMLDASLCPADYDWIRTVRMHIAVPKIIRLLGYDRLPTQGVKLNRRNIFARDRNLCQYCGQRFATSELSLDHVVPRSQGGRSTWQNLVCCCVRCNARKGGRTPVQAHMKLVRQPVEPRRHPTISIRLGHNKYASWKAFLDHAYWSVELK